MTRPTDAEAWQADWTRLGEQCKAMAKDTPALAYLAAMPSTALDGYGPGGGNGGRAKGTHGDPVANLIERKEGAPENDRGEPLPVHVPFDEWRDAEVDRVNDLVLRLYADAEIVVNAMRRIEGLKRLIDNRGDARYGRQSSVVDCLCCEATVTGVGEDRIKAGYCPTCHRAWLRYRDAEYGAGRDPVQEMFRRSRRIELAVQSERAS